jgi:hypothetical protein
LHNLTGLVRDVKANGRETLSRFAVPDRLLWYYTSVIEALRPYEDAAPVGELRERVDEFAALLAA